MITKGQKEAESEGSHVAKGLGQAGFESLIPGEGIEGLCRPRPPAHRSNCSAFPGEVWQDLINCERKA